MIYFQFFGYSGGVPTMSISTTSGILQLDSCKMLIDCGEGTYRNMLKYGHGWKEIKYILITHLHPDHIGGLLPLLFYRRVLKIRSSLTVIGPPELPEFLRSAMNFTGGEPDYPINFVDASQEILHFPEDSFRIMSALLEHRLPCYGYRIVIKEDGGEKVFTYITDTRPCQAGIGLATDCDVLVHEATFPGGMEKLAHEKYHSSIEEALILADTANAKRLIITHFSQRMDREEYENIRYRGKKCFIGNSVLEL